MYNVLITTAITNLLCILTQKIYSMKTFQAFFIALTLFTYSASNAQDKKFTSSAEAVKFINETCNKYWLVNTMKGDISREVTVYQDKCQLFFNEKSVMQTKPGTEGGEMVNTLISVNLRRVKQVGNYGYIEFAGGKKDIVTVISKGNNELNNKGQYSGRYRVALDYSNQMLKNNLYDLTTAVDYLIKTCHGKHIKKGKKKTVHTTH